MYSLTVALAVFQPETLHEMRQCLKTSRARIVQEAASVDEWNSFLEELGRKRPDILVVNLAGLNGPWEEVVHTIKTASPSTMVVAMHQSADPETILGAIRAGASEYIYPPYGETLRKALERLEEERARKGPEQGKKSCTIGVLSAKGGCGATTIASRLAPLLHRTTGKEVLLADLDFSLGLLSFLFKRKSPYSVLDALGNVHRLDLDYWRALTATVAPGVEVISAPAPQEIREAPEAESLYQFLRFVRSYYQWIILDLGRSFSASAVALIDELDHLLVVITPEVPALYQAKRIRETAQMIGVGTAKLRLVLNRVPRGFDLKPDELQDMLGLPVYTSLSEDAKNLEEIFVEGKNVLPRGPFGRDLETLAGKLSGVLPEESQRKRFTLFGRS